MGDPKKPKKKYSGPMHPWQKTRIEEEKVLTKEYGLKNKREIWKMNSKLKNFKAQVKKIIAGTTRQSEKEKILLMKKLHSLGLIKEGAAVEDILSLTTKDILERRLQTIVFKKGFAKTINQARQLITHKHIMINNKKMTSPSYLVKIDEEETISFAPNSPFFDASHPERAAAIKTK